MRYGSAAIAAARRRLGLEEGAQRPDERLMCSEAHRRRVHQIAAREGPLAERLLAPDGARAAKQIAARRSVVRAAAVLSLDEAIVAKLGGEAEKSSIDAFLCTHATGAPAAGRAPPRAIRAGGGLPPDQEHTTGERDAVE